MTKKKATPLEEGSLKDIWKYFFLPLVNYKPEDMPLKEWYENIFHLDYREIQLFTARKDFRLPGLFYAAPYVKIQGIGYRDVKKDDYLFVRKDSRDDYYDVQFFGGQGEADQMFQLSEPEFNTIRFLLEPNEGGISRRKKVRQEKRAAKGVKQ